MTHNHLIFLFLLIFLCSTRVGKRLGSSPKSCLRATWRLILVNHILSTAPSPLLNGATTKDWKTISMASSAFPCYIASHHVQTRFSVGTKSAKHLGIWFTQLKTAIAHASGSLSHIWFRTMLILEPSNAIMPLTCWLTWKILSKIKVHWGQGYCITTDSVYILSTLSKI